MNSNKREKSNNKVGENKAIRARKIQKDNKENDEKEKAYIVENNKEISKENIKNELFNLADTKYKEFHSSLCPNNSKEIFIGVRVPILRKYAKKLLKKCDNKCDSICKLINEIDNKYYEEILLKGMIIANSKLEIEKKIMLSRNFVPEIINWAICDIFCSDFKFKEDDRKVVWEFINEYKNSKKEFELRFYIVMLLDYFVTKEYIDNVLEIVQDIYIEDYYVKMAVAWLISDCYIKFKDKTETFLKGTKLDKWTYNKALQKVIESYRVSNEDKEKIRKLKR